MKDKIFPMKTNKIYKILSLLLGFSVIVYIIYVRIIWQRIPQDIPTNLYINGNMLQIIVYVIIIVILIIKISINLSKKRNNK